MIKYYPSLIWLQKQLLKLGITSGGSGGVDNFSYNNVTQNMEIPINQQMIVVGDFEIQDGVSLEINGSLAII